jgi:phenylpyruvate tautomerase PptA (4-oxalocrotonate tautomerase family)
MQLLVERIMPQTKIYGLALQLNPIKAELSEVIHSCFVDAWAYPVEKCFHRFFPLESDNFIYPADRSDRYMIIETVMFEGRSVEAKKQLIRLLYERIGDRFGIAANDIEIVLIDTPAHNWGVRGGPGDELSLNYKVKV